MRLVGGGGIAAKWCDTYRALPCAEKIGGDSVCHSGWPPQLADSDSALATFLRRLFGEETQELSKKMHTTIQRLNGVFSFLTTVAVVLGVCVGLTSFLIPSNPISELNVSNFRVVTGRAPRSGSKATEFALLNFDIDADLSSLFNWNTKQVITYIVADYTTPKYSSNAITLWDKICSSPEEAKIKLRSESQKYRFNEITGSFRGVNATYALHWNIVPWIGLMRWGKSEGVQILKTAEDAV